MMENHDKRMNDYFINVQNRLCSQKNREKHSLFPVLFLSYPMPVLSQCIYKFLYCSQRFIRKFVISFLLACKAFYCVNTVLHSIL